MWFRLQKWGSIEKEETNQEGGDLTHIEDVGTIPYGLKSGHRYYSF